MNEVPGVCVTLAPPGPNRVRVYSVISPLASRGRCHTTSMEDDDRFLVDTNTGAELGTEQTPKGFSITTDHDNKLKVGKCVDELTVVVGSKVHGAGVVVGRASTRGWSHSQHVREVLPELGEQEHVVSSGVLDGFIDSWRPLGGTFRVKTRLLQGQQVGGTAVGLQGRVPTGYDGRGAEDLGCEVPD